MVPGASQVSGFFYQATRLDSERHARSKDVYMNNALWLGPQPRNESRVNLLRANTPLGPQEDLRFHVKPRCKGGRLLGEAVQVHRGYRPKWDNRYAA